MATYHPLKVLAYADTMVPPGFKSMPSSGRFSVKLAFVKSETTS